LGQNLLIYPQLFSERLGLQEDLIEIVHSFAPVKNELNG